MLAGVEYNRNSKSLVASCFDENGKIKFIQKQLRDEDVFNWKLTANESEHMSWDEKPINKQPTNYLNRYRLEELLMEKLSDKEREYLYSDNWPVVHHLDIEVRTNERNDFPYPEEALYEVILIAVVYKNHIYVFSCMDKLEDSDVRDMESFVKDYFAGFGIETEYKVRYFHFQNEASLLQAFFYKVVPGMHLMTGWNVIEFDWQTLINRAKMYDIDPYKKLKSKKKVTRFGIPVHMGMLDYMQVCQEFKPVKMPENYTLDHMAERILGCKKLKHPYNSFHEFQKDTKMFTEYNIIDTCLTDLIEKKKKLLVIAYEMANVSKIEITKVFGPVFKTELFLCREFYKQGLHMPDIKKSGKREEYPGAYVMKPIPGYYGNIGCFDFASQYPNIMIQWFIDPKTYIGRTDEVDLSEYDAEDVVFTKYNTVFKKTENCATRIIQKGMYENRLAIKGKDGELQKVKRRISALKKRKEELKSML